LYTRFDRRNLYVTYDVTDYLAQGDNAIGVLLGNGWYNHQSKAVWDFDRAPWRNRPAFCLNLRITYEDGKTETIATGPGWKSAGGPLRFNSIYTAEHYDARLEQAGWNQPSFDDTSWADVVCCGAPSANVTAQQVEPIRLVNAIPAQSMKKFDGKTYLFDFGQNMSGVTNIKVSGPEGTVVRLKHAERLGKDGHADLSNIDVYYRGDQETEPFQTDIITLSNRDTDEYLTKFNYKGFRYVEVVSDREIDLKKTDLTAYFMHSDVAAVGKIHSSSELINKLWKATNNAYLSNLMGYPTDCPQREKNGWTGDGHFAIETALYNFDGITVYEKWLADHRDEQQENGVLPDIIPTGGWGYGTDNGLDWTSTIAIIPWNIYLFYGDDRLLEECYDNIKRYVDYVDKTSPDGLSAWGRGDWVPVKSQSDKELTSSVYFYVDTQILANAAKLFGKEEDHRYYSRLALKIKNAINGKFLNRETGIYAGGSQTELSVPLQWKVVPEEMIPLVARNLAKKVEEAGFHLDVGVLGAKAILNALSENGYAETAYRVAVQDTYPSWGWWIVNGATTLVENWNLEAERDISDNHMMFGEIGAWFYKGLGGIFPDPEAPGFKHILLRPHFMKDLSHFEARYESRYGTISSGWKWDKKGENVTYEVEIPANSSATLYLPDNVTGKKVTELTSGKHRFSLKSPLEADKVPANEVAFKITKKYLNIPVSHARDRAKMSFSVDGEQERAFTVRMAQDEIDYWVFCDVEHLKGKRVKINYEGADAALTKIYQADKIEGHADLYKEKNRPRFHFTTQRGWINDPNGLIWHEGEYHLFYQHNPYERDWENMHWGHAVSKDLVHWSQLPEALYPDHLGTMYSGSAVIDYQNTAGFNKGKTPAMIAFYTAASPDRQVQCMAYSLDKGRSWVKYEKNPLIDSKEKWNTPDTRDPKVFWYEPSSHWVMILNERDGHSIYISENLKDWKFESHITGFWECPELFELPVDGDKNNTKWVMYGATGTYMLGAFDGKTFTPEAGKFYYTTGSIYAAQTFSNIPESDGRRIQIGWGRINQPEMPFNGMMLLPTELTLRTTKNGPRLFHMPVAETAQLFTPEKKWAHLTSDQANEQLKTFYESDCLRIKTTIKLSHATSAGLNLFGQRVIDYDMNSNTLNQVFYSPEEMTSMELTADIYVDRTSIEVFIDNGAYSYSMERKPDLNNKEGYHFWGNNIDVKNLEVFSVKSIW
ncbi:MAG: family 78 glycoside hydrolase catalytic domain, partial [Bacteroidales bacterium]